MALRCRVWLFSESQAAKHHVAMTVGTYCLWSLKDNTSSRSIPKYLLHPLTPATC